MPEFSSPCPASKSLVRLSRCLPLPFRSLSKTKRYELCLINYCSPSPSVPQMLRLMPMMGVVLCWAGRSARVWLESKIRRDSGWKRGIIRMQPAGYQVEGDGGGGVCKWQLWTLVTGNLGQHVAISPGRHCVHERRRDTHLRLCVCMCQIPLNIRPRLLISCSPHRDW